ncbi:MAG: nucleotidyltransferase family protein [Deinococcota bacterium]|jgi:predicted nucleotidyltransferase|nr:nucleotidyltransferase family protein [Deinococcota bacterium]
MSATVQTKGDILAVLHRHAPQLRTLGVRRLGLFGSFVRGEATKQSDVDILVEFEPTQKTFDAYIHLVFLLEDVLQRPVELVTTEALSPHLGPHILRETEYVTLTP